MYDVTIGSRLSSSCLSDIPHVLAHSKKKGGGKLVADVFHAPRSKTKFFKKARSYKNLNLLQELGFYEYKIKVGLCEGQETRKKKIKWKT